jgi:hypothetical protein
MTRKKLHTIEFSHPHWLNPQIPTHRHRRLTIYDIYINIDTSFYICKYLKRYVATYVYFYIYTYIVIYFK